MPSHCKPLCYKWLCAWPECYTLMNTVNLKKGKKNSLYTGRVFEKPFCLPQRQITTLLLRLSFFVITPANKFNNSGATDGTCWVPGQTFILLGCAAEKRYNTHSIDSVIFAGSTWDQKEFSGQMISLLWESQKRVFGITSSLQNLYILAWTIGLVDIFNLRYDMIW